MPAVARLQALQAPLEEEEETDGRLVLLSDRVNRLDHGAGGDHRIEIATQPRKMLEDRDLGDGVQVATFVEDEVDMSERLETPAEPAHRLAHPLGDGADLAVVRAEQDHYAVGLTERVRPEDYPLVVDERHAGDSVFRLAPSLGEMALPDKEVEAFIEGHPQWSWADNEITRTFEFRDFNESMGFVTRVALAAEKADHHPDIDIRWNKVTLTLSTHSEGGLTEKDLTLADEADDLA